MNISLTIFTVLFSFCCHAQRGLPAFGKIDKVDILRTECEYNIGAEAEILIDYSNSYYDKGATGAQTFKIVTERRRRIKIFNEKGLQHANVKIGFYSYNNEERVLGVTAHTFNINIQGNIQTVTAGKKNIYLKKLNKYYSEITIAFAAVTQGSVIEYAYTIEKRNMSQLGGWNFQHELPVRYSHCRLTVPQMFRFSVQPYVIDSIERNQEVVSERIGTEKGFFDTKSLRSNYIMRKLRGIAPEPFMSTPNDYMQRLDFQLSQIDRSNGELEDVRKTWQDVVNSLREDEQFGKQLENEITASTALLYEVQGITDTLQKINFLYTHVRNNFSCTNTSEIYTSQSLNKTWQQKMGNKADINLLLVKLLKQAALSAQPILLSSRENGLVNTSFPNLQQFNTVAAYVTVANQEFILDATEKFTSYKIIPQALVNSQGFVIDESDGKWISTSSVKNKFKIITAIHGDIENDGRITGDALVNCFDYARVQRCQQWQESSANFKQQYFFDNAMKYSIEDFEWSNLFADSLPLEQRLKFKGQLSGDGNYRYFMPNIFTSLQKNDFTANERISDIDFGCLQDYVVFGNYNIPNNYAFVDTLKNITIITPDTSIIFTRSVQQNGNVLNIRIGIEFKQTLYSTDVYTDFKAFYKKMFATLNEPIVLQKRD
jgi:hypothetical protein